MTPTPELHSVAPDEIALRIFVLRSNRVLLDADLARIYGVPTKRLNEQVRRNIDRFPEDFIFPVSSQELVALRSQFATSKLTEQHHPE